MSAAPAAMQPGGFAMRLADIAVAIGARLVGTDAAVDGVSTDTRRLGQGALFVALRGPRFDGHAFLEEARRCGAAAALVDHPAAVDLPQLVVEDTRLALGRLASAWRTHFALPVVAVTGSNGKTTVKEMTAAVLGTQGEVLATQGNLNNDIGLPLTLLGLDARHRYAVLELGANHPGEIAYLGGLARPDVALVTNVGPAHLEGFGSLDGVAKAKGEIYESLAADGVAVINADEPYAGDWLRRAGARQAVRFGLQGPAEVSARWQATEAGSALALTTPAGALALQLPLAGRHNVMNALAATAAALAAGADLDAVKAGLEGLRPVPGRLEWKQGPHGLRVIDDTYNANPASLQAALAVLAGTPAPRFLALGDMGELGPDAEALHAAMGEAARTAGVNRLYGLGPLSQAAVTAFGGEARHCENHEDLISALQRDLRAGGTLLVKGSRRMQMERVVTALTIRAEDR